jgi:hypothetical protein
MTIHIGKIIQAEVEFKKLSNKEFGAMIHKSDKTVPDIYDRATMSIDLLVTISAVLKKDFLKVFYNEEPMKSLRDHEIAELTWQIQKLSEENKLLQRELTLIQRLTEAHKETISLAKEQLEDYKLKVKEFISKPDNKP